MKESIKLLLGIIDNSEDDLIDLYIKRAVVIIANYLNHEEYDNVYIMANFEDAIIALVELAYKENTSHHKGIKSQTQGARSVTYVDEKGFVISNEVKSLLPTPFLRMR